MTIKERVLVWLFGWLEDRLGAQAYRDAEHLLLLQEIVAANAKTAAEIERWGLELIGVAPRLEAIAELLEREPRLRATVQRPPIADWDELQRQNLKQFEET